MSHTTLILSTFISYQRVILLCVVFDVLLHTDPCSYLCRAEDGPALAPLAPCVGDSAWVIGSSPRTLDWRGRRTCHPSLRYAQSCCWMMLMTLKTHCWHSEICRERWKDWAWAVGLLSHGRSQLSHTLSYTTLLHVCTHLATIMRTLTDIIRPNDAVNFFLW